MEAKMKTLISALALFSFAAGPVFAQSYIPRAGNVTQPGFYGVYGFSSSSPALTGGGSLGHNQLDHAN
jgi:hypothetical protein